MKKLIKILLTAVLAMTVFVFTACSGMDGSITSPDGFEDLSGDDFTEFSENKFMDTEKYPDSYFAMDVSTASYAVLRRYIENGYEINPNMVKIEEMVNYFKYDYPAPQDGKPLSMTGSLYPCPWNNENLLFSVGIKAKDIEFESVKNNLVFLLDTSGSMDSDDKLGLLQQSFCLMADHLNENDRVSIVTYAGSSTVALNGASGREKIRIQNAITDLTAGGSTAGAGGIQKAYEIAQQNFIEGGNNRVILATDGDFNVGISSQKELEKFISKKRDSGVYLSVMGYGLGNLKNTTMDTLAQNGNGAAYYIDSLLEAKKVMVDELNGTLVTVADDVKAMVTFNPDKISKYRLLGYETKLMNEDEWDDDTADAGEIGAGHCVTAVYEIKPSQNADKISSNAKLGNDWLGSYVRYKQPFTESAPRPETDGREVQEISKTYGGDDRLNGEAFAASQDLSFISSVVEFALIARNSAYKASASVEKILSRLNALSSVVGENANEYRTDFLNMVKKYELKY